MGGFMSFRKLGFGKKVGVIEGIDLDNFNPKQTTVGVIKASGGVVYFNVKGTRVKVDTKVLDELNTYVSHLGQIKLVVSNCESLFEDAVLGEVIPWKGMMLQEYKLKNGTQAYCLKHEV